MSRLFGILAVALFLGVPCWADQLDAHARVTTQTPPTYPEADKKEGRGGLVTVLLRIDEKGGATVERVMGSGSYKFLGVVIAAAKTWTFEPSRRDNKPAPDVLEFVIVFDPKDGVRILGPLYPQ